jgi:hypothetical protein
MAQGVELNQSPEVITVRRGPEHLFGETGTPRVPAQTHTLADTRSDFSFFWKKVEDNGTILAIKAFL